MNFFKKASFYEIQMDLMGNTEKHDFVHFLPFPSRPGPQKHIEFLRVYMTWGA